MDCIGCLWHSTTITMRQYLCTVTSTVRSCFTLQFSSVHISHTLQYARRNLWKCVTFKRYFGVFISSVWNAVCQSAKSHCLTSKTKLKTPFQGLLPFHKPRQTIPANRGYICLSAYALTECTSKLEFFFRKKICTDYELFITVIQRVLMFERVGWGGVGVKR